MLFLAACASTQPATQPASSDPIAEKVNGMQAFNGYFPFYWDESSGDLWLEIDKLDTEFLYLNSLAAGIGSNDIGLDRGQLGNERIVKFVRVGPKVLMVQPNYRFRANSDNELERQAVEEAFAQSVLWGFPVEASQGDRVLVKLTNFLMQDAHGVSGRLSGSGQGSYRLNESRSAVYMDRTKNFPRNTEFEVTLTFTGSARGRYVRQVVPSPEAITVRQHHSFVQLPDDGYEVRPFDPRAGYFGSAYYDYATPIGSPLIKRVINRHRLEKKDPTAASSEAVEPIVYYLDPGTPEPVRSALLEGARWWNQAFEAAGYQNAFQVEMLPPEADPMDVRYNVIQWVHRATRGWSYGASVVDPRTGEIIKGKVTLGSLRVRQDYLIAQGLLVPYENGTRAAPEMEAMALARLRQLSAHEVGHTLGLAHNFAASVDGRASVMDYPHPFIQQVGGAPNFDRAYDVGIGEWDKVSIAYGYQDFPDGVDEGAALEELLKEAHAAGLHFISDADARPQGSAHPLAHLWDNGANAAEELHRLMDLRQAAMDRFSEKNIPTGTPMAQLEEVLVPLYFAHRYQAEATAKVVGGMYYSYALRGDDQLPVRMVPADEQRAALSGLVRTLQPKELAIPERILKLIPPRPIGYDRGRENFRIRTGLTLDPLAAAESAAGHTLTLVLHPQRASRLVEFHARDASLPGLNEVIDTLIQASWKRSEASSYYAEIGRVVDRLLLHQLFHLAGSEDANGQARAIARLHLQQLHAWLNGQLRRETDLNRRAHFTMAIAEIDRWLREPDEVEALDPLPMPDGSPIGCAGG